MAKVTPLANIAFKLLSIGPNTSVRNGYINLEVCIVFHDNGLSDHSGENIYTRADGVMLIVKRIDN
jgi:hypothetical protein